jgi:hypothetical protein
MSLFLKIGYLKHISLWFKSLELYVIQLNIYCFVFSKSKRGNKVHGKMLVLGLVFIWQLTTAVAYKKLISSTSMDEDIEDAHWCVLWFSNEPIDMLKKVS